MGQAVLAVSCLESLLCKRPKYSSFAPYYAAHLQTAAYGNAVSWCMS